MHLYEYAVLRVVPRVEREEFMNVGVVLLCRAQGFLQVRCAVPEARLRAFAPGLDLDEVAARLHAFERICQGRATGGTIGQLPLAERFRWLTAMRSTIVQTSPVHPGLCADAGQTLARLLEQLVL
ncbi:MULTISPECIES: DUF3037 domain-containing protein [Hymenobacter]|uniref:DUF3037 domain-containing protein n=1 Tax=Hymenobacter armeniacus TaxID=2771358 RepID=A0ABR8JQE0_9BACT|nr:MULTISPECIES: DUF3037 domain-containing protein [Hymenobacter]MBD2721542.1 DUF3037 domain-containing protein [Hymenobacter armeniacus]MBJ6110718.1 DUF3037 domain-containing protein [Hymenobacter sp. BT523]